jgi:hypothetical protein
MDIRSSHIGVLGLDYEHPHVMPVMVTKGCLIAGSTIVFPCIFILSRKTSTAHDPNGGLFFHASPHTVVGRLADSPPLREVRTR